MSLMTEYGRDFTGDVKSRRAQYFGSGAVKITSHDETQVKATVDGTSRYRVTVGWDDVDDAPVYHCTCPFFADQGGEPCKHCWATVLKADADGVLPKPPDWEQGAAEASARTTSMTMRRTMKLRKTSTAHRSSSASAHRRTTRPSGRTASRT